MDVISSKDRWILKNFPLGVFDYPEANPDHTAKNTLKLIKTILPIFGLDCDYIESSCQDTTSSSINVFKDPSTKLMTINECNGHVPQTALKHCVEDKVFSRRVNDSNNDSNSLDSDGIKKNLKLKSVLDDIQAIGFMNKNSVHFYIYSIEIIFRCYD